MVKIEYVWVQYRDSGLAFIGLKRFGKCYLSLRGFRGGEAHSTVDSDIVGRSSVDI
jgi:hypothetical protein